MHRKKDDILLKSAFEEFFPDLLRFFYDNIDDVIDFDKNFEFLDKELKEVFPEPEHRKGTRYADLLAKCFLKNGKEEWVLIHLEIQGGNTKNFAERMFEYWYRIYDRFKVNVAALAVFTGNKSQKRPSKYRRAFLNTIHEYSYPVYHILDHSESELLAMNNPFSFVVLAAQKALLRGKIPEQELNEQRLLIAKALLSKTNYDHERIIKFLTFLKSFIYIKSKEINHNFEKELTHVMGEEYNMGIIETIKLLEREEGIEKGIKKGIKKGAFAKSYTVVKNLLKLEKFSTTEIAGIAEVDKAFVLKVKKELGM